ncbi:hypothetical protein V1264_019590 [Littorina saxatilis]|uniref:Uncharacterized protein n=1 Tax=Littorina saxatilis TaxID=31220 RepID=A0AAN9BGU8_9CAEN
MLDRAGGSSVCQVCRGQTLFQETGLLRSFHDEGHERERGTVLTRKRRDDGGGRDHIGAYGWTEESPSSPVVETRVIFVNGESVSRGET